MSGKHYTQEKAKRTEALLERVLNTLATAKEPIKLNNRIYKTISMQSKLIIDAMYEFAEPEELRDGVIITSESSFSKSKNKTYYNMKERAKKLRIEHNLSAKGTTFHNEPTMLDLKLETERLLVRNDILETEVARLNNIIKVNEFNKNIQDTQNKSNLISSSNNPKHKELSTILAKTLSLLFKHNCAFVVNNKNGKTAEVTYRFMGETHKICNVSSLVEIMDTHIENRNGQDIVKLTAKGL